MAADVHFKVVVFFEREGNFVFLTNQQFFVMERGSDKIFVKE